MDEEARFELFSYTQTRKHFITEKMGYKFVEIWECQYKKWVQNYLDKQNEMRLLPPFARTHPGQLSEEIILSSVKKEELFGFVEVDITVGHFFISFFHDN